MDVSGQLHILGTSALRKEPMAPTGKTGWSNRQRKNPDITEKYTPSPSHTIQTVLTVILVADKDETSKVLVQSTL
jgi:hypothetical protein